MQVILLIALVAALGLLGLWLFLTWYFADEGKVLGPPEEGRVTFKQVLKGAIDDVADLFGIRAALKWLWRCWLFCGQTFGAALLSFDAYIASNPDIKASLLGSQYGLHILIGLNFVAFFARTIDAATHTGGRGRGPGAEAEATPA